jgi:uncharacterized protein YkwD
MNTQTRIAMVNGIVNSQTKVGEIGILRPVSRRGCLALTALATLVGFEAKYAHGRERYMDFASRILANPPEGAAVRKDMEAMVLRATNSYRSGKGLPALAAAPALYSKAARAHAMDLLMQAGMGHTASTGHDFSSRMRAFHEGQMVLAAMAENAARLRNSRLSDSQKALALVKQWIGSTGHRRNITNRSFVSVGIGVVARGDDVYAVQVFTGPTVKTNMFGGGLTVE